LSPELRLGQRCWRRALNFLAVGTGSITLVGAMPDD
jgi:hypothetical protein